MTEKATIRLYRLYRPAAETSSPGVLQMHANAVVRSTFEAFRPVSQRLELRFFNEFCATDSANSEATASSEPAQVAVTAE